MKVRVNKNRMVIVHPNLEGGLITFDKPDSSWEVSDDRDNALYSPKEEYHYWQVLQEKIFQWCEEGVGCHAGFFFNGLQGQKQWLQLCVFDADATKTIYFDEGVKEYNLILKFTNAMKKEIMDKSMSRKKVVW